MNRKNLFAWTLAMLALPLGAVAAPPNTPTMDGQVNVGAEWQANELVAVQTKAQGVNGFDFGPQQYMANMYVTWDASFLYIGIDGDMSSNDNNCVTIYLDNDPGAGVNPGPANTEADLTDTAGASNAGISNGHINFQPNYRPDLGIAVFLNSGGIKLSGSASGSDAAIYNITNGAAFTEGSVGGTVIVGNTSGGADDFECAIPWADVYGGPLPNNGEVGLLAVVMSTSGFSSSIYLPGLQSPSAGPLDNTGGNLVSRNTDPGLTGFTRIPTTDGAGAILTAVNETLDSTTAADPLNLNNVEQIFSLDLLQASFTDNVSLDASAAVTANYALLDGADLPFPGVTITSVVRGTGADSDQAYLSLSGPIPSGTAYKLQVTGSISANAGANQLTPPQTQVSNGFRVVDCQIDGSAADEGDYNVNLAPIIRGEWDGFFRRTPLVDSADAYPNIPGNQSVDATNGDDIFSGRLLVTNTAAQPWNYIVNTEIPNAPGSDGGANQFVGVGYWVDAPTDIVLGAADTTINFADPVENRRLNSATTVTFDVTIPQAIATPVQLTDVGAAVRLQGGTTLGGFSPEGIIAPMLTGAANLGQLLTYTGNSGTGDAEFTCDITFAAGELDVAEFRVVLNNVAASDFYESVLTGTGVHAHTARLVEGDRVTSNDQSITWGVQSYDVPALTADPFAAGDWNLYE